MKEIEILPGGVEDLADINEIYNFYIKNSNATFDTESWDQQLRQNWFQQFKDRPSLYKLFVARVNGSVSGFAYNSKFRDKQAFYTSSEVTIYIRQGYQSAGLGEKLYRILLASLSNTELHRLYAAITIPNAASIRLHEKFGFYQVATMNEVGYKNGQYHSVVFLEKKINDPV